MRPRKILVTGFTGRLGELVAADLHARFGMKPRVLVRQAHLDAADWQTPSGMEVVPGDYENPTSLDHAVAGVDAVFLVSPVHPEMRSREMALINSVARQKVRPHIVKISGLGTQLDSLVDSGRWHAEIERGVLELGLEATFLRPPFFMQNLGLQARGMRESGVLRGGIENAAIAMVDARDIAEVASAVLAGETDIQGQAVSVTGARSWTYEEVATAASAAFGKQISYIRQSPDKIRSMLSQTGQPGWHVDILLQFNEAFILGWGNPVSDTVSRVLGRPPRSLQAFLKELADGDRTSGSNPLQS